MDVCEVLLIGCSRMDYLPILENNCGGVLVRGVGVLVRGVGEFGVTAPGAT